jgi:DNA-binding response OmpR family regulator
MNILLVDNCRDIIEDFNREFSKKGHNVTWSSTALSAIELLESQTFDIVVLEWMLPIESGKVLLDWLHENKALMENTKVFVYTVIPKEVKRFTNGHRVIKKYDPVIYSEINKLDFAVQV